MFTQEVTVNNEVGLHARPATYFIQKANEFKSGIWVEKEDRRVNAKGELSWPGDAAAFMPAFANWRKEVYAGWGLAE